METAKKLEELEDVIDTLDALIERVESEEIKNALIDISLGCEKEKQDLKNSN